MDVIIFRLLVTGGLFIVLQIYWEIHMRTDDKYIAKKTSEKVLSEIIEAEKKTKKSHYLIVVRLTRVLIMKRVYLKIGVLLIILAFILQIFS